MRTAKDIVTTIIDAYAARDLDAMLACFDEEMRFHWRAQPEHVSFSGSYISKADFAELLHELDQLFIYDAYVPTIVLGEGNRASSLIDLTLIRRRDRAVVHLQLGQFWTLRRGKVIELIEFYDTAFVASWMA